MAMQLPCDAGKQQNTRSMLIVLTIIIIIIIIIIRISISISIICCYRRRRGTVLYFRIKGWSVSSEDALNSCPHGSWADFDLEPLISLILFHPGNPA